MCCGVLQRGLGLGSSACRHVWERRSRTSLVCGGSLRVAAAHAVGRSDRYVQGRCRASRRGCSGGRQRKVDSTTCHHVLWTGRSWWWVGRTGMMRRLANGGLCLLRPLRAAHQGPRLGPRLGARSSTSRACEPLCGGSCRCRPSRGGFHARVPGGGESEIYDAPRAQVPGECESESRGEVRAHAPGEYEGESRHGGGR